MSGEHLKNHKRGPQPQFGDPKLYMVNDMSDLFCKEECEVINILKFKNVPQFAGKHRGMRLTLKQMVDLTLKIKLII